MKWGPQTMSLSGRKRKWGTAGFPGRALVSRMTSHEYLGGSSDTAGTSPIAEVAAEGFSATLYDHPWITEQPDRCLLAADLRPASGSGAAPTHDCSSTSGGFDLANFPAASG